MMSEPEARRAATEHLRPIVSYILSQVEGAPINHVAALSSLAYNIGITRFRKSRLWKYYKQGEMDKVAREFLRYNKSKGKKMNGLEMRRKKEVEVFCG